MPTYSIVRKFQNTEFNAVLKTGVTLEEAKEHCSDPETSSKTCTDIFLVEMTKACGPWFDAFEEE